MIESLAGRTMYLGDGFRRYPEERDSLLKVLEMRGGELKDMRVIIRGFDVEEHWQW